LVEASVHQPAFRFQSLGNHEFDEGTKNLENFLKAVDFPVLAANLDLSKEPGLASAKQMVPSMELTVGGRRVGIIGYLTPETKEAAAANEVEFIDEVVAIK
jgi:5'-nucleotidase